MDTKLERSKRRKIELDEKILPWLEVMKEHLMREKDSKVELTLEIGEDELHLNKLERMKAERENKQNDQFEQERKNYFVKDIIGEKIYFVKRDYNLRYSAKEWFVNQQLAKAKVDHLILAKFFFFSEDDGEAAGFLVFDFIPICTLNQIIDARCQDEVTGIPKLKIRDLLQGLCDIISIFARISNNGQVFNFSHNDLTTRQIGYGLFDKKWYLLDFGSSSLSYMSQIQVEGQLLDVEIHISADKEKKTRR